MSDRIHMGTLNVWRWYWRSPIDHYDTANWYRVPKFGIGWDATNRQAPTRLAGRRTPFLSIAYHKKAWRIGRMPIAWKMETVLDYIEENGGWPVVPDTIPEATP